MNCAGCCSIINDNDYHTCIKCNDSYDYSCLNISSKDDFRIAEKNKTNWLCPGCLSKQPKSDNTNLPARPSTPTGLADITFNSRTRPKVQAKQDTVIPSNKTSDYVSRSEIGDIIRAEIRSAIHDSIGELNYSINSRLSDLQEQLSTFQESQNFLSGQFDSFRGDVLTCMKDNEILKSENVRLRSEVNSLNNRISNLDQMSRATNLEIQCVPEHRSENVLSIYLKQLFSLKQLGNVVKYPVNEKDIAFCSRVAKKDNSSTRPRSILLKFTTPRIRDCLLAAVLQYNKEHKQEKLTSSDLGIDDKKTPIYVVENLSPENKQLHAAARLRTKELNYKFVWVRGGRIYVRKSESTEAIYIRNMESLKKLV
ncbi:unnamed protein product [Diatraea saccharalis]|uniref:FP protein C-terminal domain-containing protein n=1 Tax=Diatraea saccharalis TaxID=40085 RepID=A0A9N9QY25_9NEOP|nr:unnamed protein product [Diatraea saccharalis]